MLEGKSAVRERKAVAAFCCLQNNSIPDSKLIGRQGAIQCVSVLGMRRLDRLSLVSFVETDKLYFIYNRSCRLSNT